MVLIGGKHVHTTVEEIVRPDHTALLVVDVQNDYLDDEGALSRLGKGVSMCQGILPRLKRVLKEARECGVMVVYIQSSSLPGLRSRSAPALYFWHVRYGMPLDEDRVVEGTWGHEIVSAIAPGEGDLVVKKWRPSAFIGTNLDLLLRSNGIETIVVTAVATDGCVMATALVGFYHDYYAVVARDCVATIDQPATTRRWT